MPRPARRVIRETTQPTDRIGVRLRTIMRSGVRRAGVVVGREVELDRLLRSVHAARAGEASCVLLVGEGGVGKTRLLTEASAAARRLDVAVLSGRAPITTPVAFSVFAEAVRSWLRGHPIDLPASAFDRGLQMVVPEWPAPAEQAELSDAQLRLLAFEGLVRLVREIAASRRGAVVLLDDLHAADPESVEAVRYLATAAIPSTTVVAALRPGESQLADELVRALQGDGVAAALEVAPLQRRSVADLIAALLDAQPPPPLVDDVVARTDGVPLLVEEVVEAHLRSGSIELGDAGAIWRGGGGAGVPRSVRDMVGDRLERLERDHRTVLVAGAVVGDFEPSAMPAVAGVDALTVADGVVAGIRAGLLETGGGAVAFRHAIIREAVVASAVPHTLMGMHRRAEEAFRGAAAGDTRALERRSHHLVALGERDAAAALLVAASAVRLAEHALLGAERLGRDALELAGTAAVRAEAADAVARALAAQGRWSEALLLDERTAADHGETPERRRRMATSAIEAGRPDVARRIIARALEAGDESGALRIAAGRAALVGGDADAALGHADTVLGSDSGDLDARLAALELRGRALDFLGRREDAGQTWERQAVEARAAGRTQAQLRAVVQLGKVELFAGQRPARLREAVELAREAGALVELSWAQENLAVGLILHGEAEAGGEVLRDAVARARELRLDQLPYLLAHLAHVESHTRDPVDDLLEEAERLAPGGSDVLLHTTGVRGDVALRRGRYVEAVRWLAEATRMAREMPGAVPMDAPCYLVWALAGAGRREAAAAALDEARCMPGLERWYARPVVLAAGAALLAGDEAGIDSALAAAPAPMPMDAALMRMTGADILRGPASARWLREALDHYAGLGMTIEADRARRLLREVGGPVPRRRAAPASIPESLAKRGVTARETDVLRLLGEGLSNAEIAQRLFLSVRTVETHVSSMLGKLEARSRGQLIALSHTLER
jgi:DNA-binding CsgD family transcriptional regulator/tetratricopeptide (TPR) repeat protein